MNGTTLLTLKEFCATRKADDLSLSTFYMLYRREQESNKISEISDLKPVSEWEKLLKTYKSR